MLSLQLTTLVGVICVCVASHQKYVRLENTHLQKRRILCGGIRTCGSIVTPLVLFQMLPPEDKTCRAVIPAFLWISFINLLDSFLLFNSESSTKTKPASILMEPTCITGLTFALCGFIGTRYEQKYGNLFLYSVMACLACVLPSHNLHPDAVEAQVFESVQKSILFGCIATLIAGVCLVHNSKTSVYSSPPTG